jgi:hypothetical protein
MLTAVGFLCVCGFCRLLDALSRACEDQQFQLKLWQKLEESGGITVLPPQSNRSSADGSKKKRASKAAEYSGMPPGPWGKRR